MLQLVERTIVRYACWHGWHGWSVSTRCSRYWAEYRTIVKSEARQHQFARLASGQERTIVHFHTRPQAPPNKRKKKSRGTAVWATPTPNKSESPSPTARLVKPDPPRLTEHTKCRCYFVGVTLLCSIVCGSLWVFVATFMRFCATS